MDPNLDRHRKTAAIAILAFVIIGSLIFLLALPGDKTPDTESNNQEAATGPEASQNQVGVSYPGFGDLSQHGFTSVQMSGISYALFQFAPKATSFAIAPSTIVDDPYDPEKGASSTATRFDLTIEKTTYKAVVEKYLDFKTVRVQLSANGKVVYASEPIDVDNLKPTDSTGGD